jgi:hypothetical protein
MLVFSHLISSLWSFCIAWILLGTLPSSLGALTSLEFISVSENSLSGQCHPKYAQLLWH